MAIELEKIQPWDGQSGTGADARGVIDRNFEKIETELETTSENLVQLAGKITYNVNIELNTPHTIYTLSEAIALVPAESRRRGMIVTFLEYYVSSTIGSYASYRYVYSGGQQPSTDAVFLSESNWLNIIDELLDKKTRIFLNERYEDITETYIDLTPSVNINNMGVVGSTGRGTTVLTYNIEPLDEFALLLTGGSYNNAIYACFYDEEGNPFSDFREYIAGNGTYEIYHITAPLGAKTLKVCHKGTVGYPTVVAKLKTIEKREELRNKYIDYTALDLSDTAKMFQPKGNIATPIDIIENYRIQIGFNINNKRGDLVPDTRANLYKFKNGYYQCGSMGASFSLCAVAYDIFGNVIKIIKGEGIHSNVEIYPVENADYILISSSSKVNNVYEVGNFVKKAIPNFEFNPIPIKDNLKILCLGNSFTQDSMEYLPEILRNANINDVTLGQTILSGGTLQDYYGLMLSQEAISYRKGVNSANISVIGNQSLNQLLTDEKWDIVVLQQRSTINYLYHTFAPYMNALIEYISNKVKNRKLCFMFNMTWSGAQSYTGVDETQRYNDIVDATKKMIAEIGIPYIIPGGTAIQRARGTDIQTTDSWTRDGYHIEYGVGRYVLAATWFQYIFGWVYNVDIKDYTDFRISVGTPVTGENINTLNECAAKSVDRRFI